MRSELYYESHVTFDPQSGEPLEALKLLCDETGFRLADLVMIKVGGQLVPSQKDSFVTTRGKDLEEITQRTKRLIESCEKIQIKVRRYKIEDTIIDSKIKDTLGLLEQ